MHEHRVAPIGWKIHENGRHNHRGEVCHRRRGGCRHGGHRARRRFSACYLFMIVSAQLRVDKSATGMGKRNDGRGGDDIAGRVNERKAMCGRETEGASPKG